MGLGVRGPQLAKSGLVILHPGAVEYVDIASDDDNPSRNTPLEVIVQRGSPVAIIFDAMTCLFRLHPTATTFEVGSETYTTPRKSGIASQTTIATYAPADIYNVFAQKLLLMVSPYATKYDVTLVIVFDKSTLVVPEKADLQSKRTAATPIPPYPCPDDKDILHTSQFLDHGLVLDPKHNSDAINVHPRRIMCTRWLRPFWFDYLTRCLSADSRFAGIELLVDYACDGPYELRNDAVIKRPELSVLCGEGEVAGMALCYMYAPTHHVQLWSGDSDVIALGLMHGHYISDTFVVTIMGVGGGTCQSMLPARVGSDLRLQGWSMASLCLALMINGTDYIDKSKLLYYINTGCIMHAVRDVVRPTDSHEGDMALVRQICGCSLSFHRLIVRILSTHYHGKERNPALMTMTWNAPLVSDIPTMSTQDLERRRVVRSSGRVVGIPKNQAVEENRQQTAFNWNYWYSLQSFSSRFDVKSASLSLGVVCAMGGLDRQLLDHVRRTQKVEAVGC